MSQTASHRTERQDAIREIVRDRRVGSQVELVRALRDRGIRVTQATVSRDVHALGLVKSLENGGSRYVLPQAGLAKPSPRSEAALANLRQAFQRSVLGLAQPESMLVLRTPSGFANSVAVALDQAAYEEIVATLAGDDTILVLLREAGDRAKMVKVLGQMLK